jgi:hypothetical protein
LEQAAAAGGEMVSWGDGEESTGYESSDSEADVSALLLPLKSLSEILVRCID